MLAHRGLWSPGVEENSLEALFRAAQAGFGIELDIRDFGGELVVSHDLASTASPSFGEVLSVISDQPVGVLALNVKSDGLLPLLEGFQSQLRSMDHFFFDMSLPELLRYESAGWPIALRFSEFEPTEAHSHFSPKAVAALWLDSFQSDGWLLHQWEGLLANDLPMYVVSPELHNRKPQAIWMKVTDTRKNGFNIGICTDAPFEFIAAGETT